MEFLISRKYTPESFFKKFNMIFPEFQKRIWDSESFSKGFSFKIIYQQHAKKKRE